MEEHHHHHDGHRQQQQKRCAVTTGFVVLLLVKLKATPLLIFIAPTPVDVALRLYKTEGSAAASNFRAHGATREHG
jgi:hypothetical protein